MQDDGRRRVQVGISHHFFFPGLKRNIPFDVDSERVFHGLGEEVAVAVPLLGDVVHGVEVKLHESFLALFLVSGAEYKVVLVLQRCPEVAAPHAYLSAEVPVEGHFRPVILFGDPLAADLYLRRHVQRELVLVDNRAVAERADNRPRVFRDAAHHTFEGTPQQLLSRLLALAGEVGFINLFDFSSVSRDCFPEPNVAAQEAKHFLGDWQVRLGHCLLELDVALLVIGQHFLVIVQHRLRVPDVVVRRVVFTPGHRRDTVAHKLALPLELLFVHFKGVLVRLLVDYRELTREPCVAGLQRLGVLDCPVDDTRRRRLRVRRADRLPYGCQAPRVPDIRALDVAGNPDADQGAVAARDYVVARLLQRLVLRELFLVAVRESREVIHRRIGSVQGIVRVLEQKYLVLRHDDVVESLGLVLAEPILPLRKLRVKLPEPVALGRVKAACANQLVLQLLEHCPFGHGKAGVHAVLFGAERVCGSFPGQLSHVLQERHPRGRATEFALQVVPAARHAVHSRDGVRCLHRERLHDQLAPLRRRGAGLVVGPGDEPVLLELVRAHLFPEASRAL